MGKYVVYYDEAGRGPLAGPVYAGVSIKLNEFSDSEFDDSKKITSKNRGILYKSIQLLEEQGKLKFGFGFGTEKEIDKYGIIPAIKLAIIRAVNNLFIKIENPNIENEVELFHYFINKYVEKFVLDGDSDFGLSKLVETETIIKGDGKVKMIGIASIVAKEEHDLYIISNYCDGSEYEKYGFLNHKGYGTKVHLEALSKYGVSDIHRKTFCKKFL